jgi:hypothetical protein
MKTAIEWLVSELVKNKFIQEEGAFTQPLIIKAKEMEKQRIKNEREEAYKNGYANGQMDAFTN